MRILLLLLLHAREIGYPAGDDERRLFEDFSLNYVKWLKAADTAGGR